MSAPHNALGISMRYKNGWEAWKTMSVPKDFTMERLDYDRFAIYDAEGNRHSTHMNVAHISTPPSGHVWGRRGGGVIKNRCRPGVAYGAENKNT